VVTRRLRLVIAALALVEAGYMATDGIRALVVGDYITPRSGRFAGQLGPGRLWCRPSGSHRAQPL
jgi:hypothetical protein